MTLPNDPRHGRIGSRSLVRALGLPAYAVPVLPPASAYRGRLIAVSNGNAGQPSLAFSDGSGWRRIALGPEIGDAPASAYAAHVLADGPAAYWRLDEQAGGVFDDSGNNRNAAAINLTGPMRSEPSPLRGENATCFRFDGAARHVISGVNAAALNIDGTKPKTIEAWVRADGLGITFTGAWEIGTRTLAQYLSLSHTDSATGYAISTYGANANFTGAGHGTWMLVHVTYDPTEPTDKLKAYVNGTLAAQSSLATNLGTGIPFLIGALDGRQFTGAVAEVAVFDKVLPTARMLERHALAGTGTLPVPYQAEVLADRPRLYWRNHLPDGNQHLTPDLSGYNLGGDTFYVTRSQESALLNDPSDTSFGWTGLGQGPGKTQELVQSNGLEGSGFADGATLGIGGAAASWTVETWIRPTGTHNFRGVWEMGAKAAGQFAGLLTGGTGDHKLYVHTWGGAPLGAGAAVPWDQWTLVHVTYDHTASTVALYLNGSATAAYSVPYAISLPATGWTFSSGRLDANQWLGLIDETAVYQGVLPAARRLARWTASGRA